MKHTLVVMLFVWVPFCAESFPSTLNLAELTNGTNGFAVYGAGASDQLGGALAVGDFNGDGRTDIACSAMVFVLRKT